MAKQKTPVEKEARAKVDAYSQVINSIERRAWNKAIDAAESAIADLDGSKNTIADIAAKIRELKLT